jgi:hypothetical protein
LLGVSTHADCTAPAGQGLDKDLGAGASGARDGHLGVKAYTPGGSSAGCDGGVGCSRGWRSVTPEALLAPPGEDDWGVGRMWGLGTVRSLEQLQEHMGVDFRKRSIVSSWALTGGIGSDQIDC